MTHETAPSPTMRAPHVPEIPEGLRAAAGALLSESGSPARTAFRMAAWNAFAAQGLPGSKHEDFSFVSAADLKSTLTRLPNENKTAAKNAAPVLTVTQGTASLNNLDAGNDAGVSAWMDSVRAESDLPANLAATFAPAPGSLELKATEATEATLVFAGDANRADYAVVVNVPTNSEATLHLRSENGSATDLVNAAVYFRVGAGARLTVFQQDAAQGFQFLKLHFSVDRDARVELLTVSTGSRLARLALEADLLAPGASLDLRGASAVTATDRVHRHLKIRHAAPHCTSNQLFKAVVHGSARSSVDGTVTVDRGAQQTDARQLLQHLLQSPEGRADAKPRLLIHADDVKCSHGATVGKTDPAQLFYLLSRGLDKAAADSLLTQAFLGEALAIAPEAVRGSAWTALTTGLRNS